MLISVVDNRQILMPELPDFLEEQFYNNSRVVILFFSEHDCTCYNDVKGLFPIVPSSTMFNLLINVPTHL